MANLALFLLLLSGPLLTEADPPTTMTLALNKYWKLKPGYTSRDFLNALATFTDVVSNSNMHFTIFVLDSTRVTETRSACEEYYSL
eukprot:XP_014779406.1 PREDICTED: uncharacterized protein LOC106875678 isoform X2 [Octopus bimaculoides]